VNAPNRRFAYEALASGLELELVTPDDVIAHVTPEVLAHHLPIALKAKLLQASLSAERVTPALVIEVVGLDALVEHAPLPVLWACVRACAARALQSQSDDALSASLGIAAVNAAVAAVGGNGAGAMNGAMTDDLQMKPAKTARPMALRPGSSPPRVSALSPRSQVMRRPDPTSNPAPSGAFDVARGEEPPDFEIVEETEVPTRARTPSRGGLIDDDTRPGSKP
jgi:hypothetical protein